MRIVRETVAETKTCKWYDGQGLLRIKLNLQGRRGWPDQEFFIPGGQPFLIEFKAEGEEPRTLQAYIHKQLKEAGYDVEVHTDHIAAIAAIKRRIEAARKTGARARGRGAAGKEGRAVDA